MTDQPAELAQRFVRALVDADGDGLAQVLDPDVDFRGLTPGRAWEAGGVAAVRDVLGQWFEPSDHLQEVLRLETGSMADRQSLTYRLRGTNDDGPFVVEQTAYFTVADGRIDWLRILCSGFRTP